uniref:Rem2-and rab-like small gtpase 1 n=1 Tax=Tetraselmis sp. GSL018 TaxID=582737 RepID=A0A061RNE4_9CHLO
MTLFVTKGCPEAVTSLIKYLFSSRMGILEALSEVNVARKIAVLGRSGSGKTSLIRCLSNEPVNERHCETIGLQVTSVRGPVVYDATGNEQGFSMYRFWEAGSRYGQKFPYMTAEVMKDCVAAIVVFSFSDRESFSDVPLLLDSCEGLPCLVVGTRASDPAAWAVTAQLRK